MYLEFALPESSRNRLIQLANLVKKGFAKWETLPKTTRNITAGSAFLVTGIVLPKLIFMGAVSSFFLGKHLYLNGEIEEAAKEIITEDTATDKTDQDENLGHP